VSGESLNSRHVAIQMAGLGSLSLIALFCSVVRRHGVRDCIFSSLVVLYGSYTCISF
jgi:Ca2+/Na+ antiporter